MEQWNLQEDWIQVVEDSKIIHVQNAPLGGILMLMESVKQSTISAKRGVIKMETVSPATEAILSMLAHAKPMLAVPAVMALALMTCVRNLMKMGFA